MQTEQYEGEVTAVGENIGIVPDAAFFRAHPEFNQRAAQAVRLLTFDCNDKPKTKELGLTGLSGLIANQYSLEIVRPAHIQK